jgi:hypothetical protein
MQGQSYRAIQEWLGAKGVRTAEMAVARGREYALDHGVDVEQVRLKITAIFDEMISAGALQLKDQQKNGQEVFFVDQDGNKSMKRTRGMDTRLMGEMSRSLQRWAEFCGLMDRAPEQNSQTTLIQLSAPTAGTDFESRYNNMPSAAAEDPALAASTATTVQAQVLSEGGPGWGEPPATEGEQAAA